MSRNEIVTNKNEIPMKPALAANANVVKKQQTEPVLKPPPSPPIKVRAKVYDNSNDHRQQSIKESPKQIYSRSMPVSLVSRPSLGSRAIQANRLRERYLQSLHIHPKRSLDIPLTTTSAVRNNSNATVPVERKPENISGKDLFRTKESVSREPLRKTEAQRITYGNHYKQMGSLDAFWQNREAIAHNISQPVEIRAKQSDAILGFWDKRPDYPSSRRRHTTGGSSLRPRRRATGNHHRHYHSTNDGEDAKNNPNRKECEISRASKQIHSKDDHTMMKKSSSIGSTGAESIAGMDIIGTDMDEDEDICDGSHETYLTAAAVNRSRRNTTDSRKSLQVSARLDPVSQKFETRQSVRSNDTLTSMHTGLRGPSSLMSATSGASANTNEVETETDDQLDLDQLLFTDEPASPVTAPLASGSSRGSVRRQVLFASSYGSSQPSSNTDEGRDDGRSIVSDSDTEGIGISAPDSRRQCTSHNRNNRGIETRHSGSKQNTLNNSHNRSHHTFQSTRFHFNERERRRRHSSADTPFAFDVDWLREEGTRGDGEWHTEQAEFVPPHMMADQQRGAFSMGYHHTFRPKPKDI